MLSFCIALCFSTVNLVQNVITNTRKVLLLHLHYTCKIPHFLLLNVKYQVAFTFHRLLESEYSAFVMFGSYTYVFD